MLQFIGYNNSFVTSHVIDICILLKLKYDHLSHATLSHYFIINDGIAKTLRIVGNIIYIYIFFVMLEITMLYGCT
jgi:hypothetical protein